MTLEERLATIEAHAQDIKALIKEIKVALDNQNGRIRSLEIWRGYILGAMAIVVAGGPLVWKLVALIWL